MEQIVKCQICGEPYKFYSHYAGDQSACPECRNKAKEKEGQWYQRYKRPSNIVSSNQFKYFSGH